MHQTIFSTLIDTNLSLMRCNLLKSVWIKDFAKLMNSNVTLHSWDFFVLKVTMLLALIMSFKLFSWQNFHFLSAYSSKLSENFIVGQHEI